jgi:hypothetical protein
MSNDYAAERGIPTGPACARSAISLRFDGRCLVLSGPNTSAYPAVSGRALAGATFDYSVQRQRLRDTGPIPAGQYWVQPSQMWDNAWYRVAAPRSVWGNHRLTIHILPGTQTHGRGGFFIHGGTHDGTAGCINLHAWMDSFADDLAVATKDSRDCYVPLSVAYLT